MRKRFIYWMPLCLWLFASTIMGNDLTYNTGVFSPQVSEMFRYGATETSLHTGRLNFSIPIFTLEDPDFNLTLKLRYNGEGFRPRKHSGFVGYGWFLEGGGCITREVQNYPDEAYRFLPGTTHRMMGMLCFTRQHKYPKDAVFNLSNSSIYTECGWCGYNIGANCEIDVDYMPDLFRFNFDGYQGTFMINNEGKAVIIDGDYVEIDLSKLHDEKPLCQTTAIPFPKDDITITIRTLDGYTYLFGGDLSSIEFCIPAINSKQIVTKQQETMNGAPAQHSPVPINAWHLKKVIAPNGRTITYHYKKMQSFKGQSDNLWLFCENYNLLWQLYGQPNIGQTHMIYSVTKECILDSICISSTTPLTIRFNSSVEEHKKYGHSFYSLCQRNYQLDHIVISSQGRILKRADLTYQYAKSQTNEFYWRFLSEVKLSGVGNYLLDYYKNLAFPDIYCPEDSYLQKEADEYGYWKGNSELGMLKQVVFPTGGKQVFSYGQHYYEKKQRYQLLGTSDVEMITLATPGQLHGARIHKIETYETNNHLVETRTYSYFNGIFHDRFYFYGIPNTPSTGIPIDYRYNYSLLDTHIRYGQVTETILSLPTNETNKVIYTFSMGRDSYSSINDNSFNHHISNTNENAYVVLSGALFYDSKLVRPGKLTSIVHYRDNQPLKTKKYMYNGTPMSTTELTPIGAASLGCTDTIVTFSHYNGAYVAKKLFVYPYVLNQEVIYDYSSPTMPLITNYTFTYDKHLRCKEKCVDNSDNYRYFTRYTYLDEIVPTGNLHRNPYTTLVHSLRIIDPIETISGYYNGNTEHVTHGIVNLYSMGMSFIMPPLRVSPIDTLFPKDSVSPYPTDSMALGEVKFYPYLNKTLELCVNNSIDTYQPIRMTSDGTVLYDPHYTLSTEYTFDVQGRLTSIQPSGQIATTYTWNGLYPTSQVTGNQTHHYTYIPYVGISSSTNERGITTYYQYDNEGRLTESYQIIDGRKEILEYHHYHIKSE